MADSQKIQCATLVLVHVCQYILFIDLTSCSFVISLHGGHSDSRGEGLGGVRGGRDKRVVKKLMRWKSTLLIAIQAPGEPRYNKYTECQISIRSMF
jgi:hypothetical protein